ncbi:hypothetical protein Plec18167_004689 [Paecilomyces lecythidis]|uniref:Uncharacterized protein n=1 Tax=Paecilomyces lecythidis TaxID=3004212 RepID=A0ABR3XQ32_9EURO
MTKRSSERRSNISVAATPHLSGRARSDGYSSPIPRSASAPLHGDNAGSVAALESSEALPGYLGSTSYSAVLAENGSAIPVDAENEPESAISARFTDALDPNRVQPGVEVLRLLYDVTIFDLLIGQYYERVRVAVMPLRIIEDVFSSIRRVFSSFNAHDTERRLHDLAIRVHHNSSKPLVTHRSMTFEEYSILFTGENSRWEAVGNIFAIAGMSLMATPDNDPILTQGNVGYSKDEVLAQTAEASNICLSFCDKAASANELLAFLQYNDVMRRTQQYGDAMGGEPLDHAIAGLDPSGWDRSGTVHRVSVVRLRFMLAIFREEALEIALGQPQGDIAEKSK